MAFESLTDPAGTRVVEQNFQFDLVSTEKLLERFIDQEIEVERQLTNGFEVVRGTLLAAQNGMVLRRDDGSVQLLPYNAGTRLPSLPGGLITRPTLVWDINAKQAGRHDTRVSYQTGGLTWWTDYNLRLDEKERATQCDIAAWVTIVNQSGASYPEAKLKLVAGEVHRAPVQTEARYLAKGRATMAMAEASKDEGFSEKSFFEYHLYTLGRPSTLPDNSTKQLELFPTARGVPCEKTLVYYGQAGMEYGFFGNPMTDRDFGVASNKKVDVYLGFKNGGEQKLGVPLPAGRVRVAKTDPADGTLEFIGEDRINHTAKNESVRIKLGEAFDVVGERRQVDFRVDVKRNWMAEDIEIKLRNRKTEPVTVIAKENLYRWVNWKITQKSHDFQKIDARTVHFPLRIAPDEEVVLRYSVSYTW